MKHLYKKINICLLLFFIACNATAQDDPINTGAANFMTIIPDARTSAMGGAGTALPGNDNAIFYNGATSLSDENRTGGFSYTFIPWMRDYESGYSLNSLGGYYKINKKNAILAGFRYYNYPKVEVMEMNPDVNHTIHPKEFALDLGYAREITTRLALSGTLRFIHSNMGSINGAKNAGALAFDLGGLYKQSIKGIDNANWAVGLQLSNIGSKIKYLNSKESLPSVVKFGGSVDLPFSTVHKLLVTTDVGYRLSPSDVSAFNVSTGLEYTLIEHIMLRGGYHYGDDKKADASYATAGLGVKFSGIHIDFSWLFAKTDNPWKNTFWISAGYSF